MQTATGLDILIADGFARFRGRRVGLLCNQASIDHRFRHILDVLLPLHRSGFLTLAAVFGPQHGLHGHTQDNMIEWRSGTSGPVPVFSLYGETRKPTPEMLEGIDSFLVDVPDVGARYYTFAWTMAHCMEACASAGIPVTVLDRPNPICGTRIEGPVLQVGFESFVGLHPLPTRHGMTIGEVAGFVHSRMSKNCELNVIPVQGWDRSRYLDETDVPWAMPSPNMPTVDTAVVYPGGCLLEGTNLSEGRGTTRPFEIAGAPFLNGENLAAALNQLSLGGVYFRPIQFEPTFNKHGGKLCEGVFVHVTDREAFEPVLTYVALIQEAVRQTGSHHVPADTPLDKTFVADSQECDLPGFAWRRPPYEYEFERAPFDLLAGNSWLRHEIEDLTELSHIREKLAAEADDFRRDRDRFLR